jgi:hyperosmotically inducible protein
MKTKSLLTACLFLMGVFLFACKPSDSKIQQAANEKLSASPGVTVEVMSGVVTLTGEVPDETSKSAAEDAVKTVPGVKSVTNNITVKAMEPPMPPVTVSPDEMLKKSLDSAYNAQGMTGIMVVVMDGEVTLSGDAKKSDLQKIMKTAQESKPKKVVNKLTLK